MKGIVEEFGELWLEDGYRPVVQYFRAVTPLSYLKRKKEREIAKYFLTAYCSKLFAKEEQSSK